MVYKKMKMKNSSMTATSYIISILFVIGIFTGMFLYMEDNASSNDVTIDSKYNDTYVKLNNISSAIEENNVELESAIKNITEADSALRVAVGGFKGLGSILKSLISFLDYGITATDVVTGDINVIPAWVKVLFSVGLLIVVILLLLRIFTGGNTAL